MDLLSLLGFIFGTGFVIVSILLGEDPVTGAATINPGQLSGFWDLPSVMIVIGGTIAALMISFPIKSFTKIPKHLKIIFLPKKYNPQSYIEQIVFFAKEARINGLLALEDKLNSTQDKFIKNSLLLVVDSVEPEKVRGLLNKELDYLDERHAQDMAFYNKASEYSPAFGMVGTLIGLINLLANLSDTEALTKNMAVALVTTFYGVILANVIFKPIANKLKVRHEEEYLCKMIISEGVQAIQDGDNPTFIQEKLTRLLPSYSLKGELKNPGK
jgi:chemotaxis protein MotA